jgi:hypothetical protein
MCISTACGTTVRRFAAVGRVRCWGGGLVRRFAAVGRVLFLGGGGWKDELQPLYVRVYSSTFQSQNLDGL